MRKAAYAFLLTALMVSACGKSSDSMGHSMDGDMSGMDHKDAHMHMAPVADQEAADRVKAMFKLSENKVQSKQDTTITVDITDIDGKPLDKFDIQHEKQMHMILVSKDLSYFHHIHPAYKGNGEFAVTTQFPSGGEFEIISDFAPAGIGAMSKSTWIHIEGESPAAKPIEPDAKLTKVVDGQEVTLTFDHLMAGMELDLNFAIHDAASKEPVTDLQPYLGAVGHVVILNKDGGEYLHVHPTEEHATGPDAKFKATFPHSGLYKIWGQFQRDGQVFTVPFVVQVP